MFVAKDLLGNVIVEGNTVLEIQEYLKDHGWKPQVLSIDYSAPKPSSVVDETGLKWQRVGKPQRCGYIGVSFTEYATIGEAV